jgi:flagellar basal-body rod modification protein FlgD
MSVQAITDLSPTVSSLYTTKSNATVDKEDFLKLLITQIQQQDPLNPQDPAEFTAQLTQFSNLEQLISLNTAMEDLQMLQLSSNNAQAANLIGKNVLYDGGTVQVQGGAPGSLYVVAPGTVKDVTVSIKDSSGSVVRTIQLGSLSGGIQAISWDGLKSTGDPASDGAYTFTVTAVDAQGNSAAVTPLSLGHVGGVSFEDGVTYLNVGGEKVSLSDVRSVREP